MREMRRYADLYGSALPLQYTIERNALANMSREGPMKSNNFGKNKAFSLCFKFLRIENTHQSL